MKKVILVLVFALICLSVFADTRVRLYISPYSWHKITSSEYEDLPVYGPYGFGVKADCAVTPFDNNLNLLTGGEINFNPSYLKSNENWFYSWAFLAKLGYEFNINDKVFMAPVGLYGLEIQHYEEEYEKATSVAQIFGAAASFDFLVNKHLSVVGDVEGLFTMTGKDGVRYMNYKISAYVGMGYSFY